ncbi:MAG: Uma2 family endonuclease [Candidatus Poribacteria bacterium]|nr:Uma2 family endonuclease [Candidatus Poribacteria bacterium]
MTQTSLSIEHSPLRLRLHPAIDMTDDQFYEFCRINRDLRIERTAKGDLIIMPPTGWETGHRNSELNAILRNWAKKDGSGIVSDSSTGFNLPGGANRAPDAAWVKRSRLAALTPKEKRKFLPLCPDFVIELRSPSDNLNDLQDKMQEYIDNGAQLGWLIDPDEKRIYVYRPHSEVECLENPSTIAGEPVLPGFVLDLQDIWEPDF